MENKKMFSAILALSMLTASLPMVAMDSSDSENPQQQQQKKEEEPKEKKQSLFGKWSDTLWTKRSTPAKAGIGIAAGLVGLWSLFNVVPTVFKYTVKPLFNIAKWTYKPALLIGGIWKFVDTIKPKEKGTLEFLQEKGKNVLGLGQQLIGGLTNLCGPIC